MLWKSTALNLVKAYSHFCGLFGLICCRQLSIAKVPAKLFVVTTEVQDESIKWPEQDLKYYTCSQSGLSGAPSEVYCDPEEFFA